MSENGTKRASVCKKGWILKQSNRLVLCLCNINVHNSFPLPINERAHTLHHFGRFFSFIFVRMKREMQVQNSNYPIEMLLCRAHMCSMFIEKGSIVLCTYSVLLFANTVVASSHDLVSIIKLTNSDAFINNKNSADRIYFHSLTKRFIWSPYFLFHWKPNSQ